MQQFPDFALPVTDTDEIDFDTLDTDTRTYEDLDVGDVLVYPDYEYICVVVADPIYQAFRSPERYKIPAIGLDGILQLTEDWRLGRRKPDRQAEVIDVITTHVEYELGEPSEEVLVYNNNNDDDDDD